MAEVLEQSASPLTAKEAAAVAEILEQPESPVAATQETETADAEKPEAKAAELEAAEHMAVCRPQFAPSYNPVVTGPGVESEAQQLDSLDTPVAVIEEPKASLPELAAAPPCVCQLTPVYNPCAPADVAADVPAAKCVVDQLEEPAVKSVEEEATLAVPSAEVESKVLEEEIAAESPAKGEAEAKSPTSPASPEVTSPVKARVKAAQERLAKAKADSMPTSLEPAEESNAEVPAPESRSVQPPEQVSEAMSSSAPPPTEDPAPTKPPASRTQDVAGSVGPSTAPPSRASGSGQRGGTLDARRSAAPAASSMDAKPKGGQTMSEIDKQMANRLERFFSDDKLAQQVQTVVSNTRSLYSNVGRGRAPNSSEVGFFRVHVPKPYPGVQYRKSKSLNDRYMRFAANGDTVEGTVEDEGEWLKISANVFIPMRVGSVQILEPVVDPASTATVIQGADAAKPTACWSCTCQ